MSSERHINCHWVLERIDARIDDDLVAEEAVAFDRHVADCPECAQELSFARNVVSELRGLPEHPCPPGLVEEAQARARAIAGHASGHAPSLRERIAGWFEPRIEVLFRPAMVAMVVVVAAVSVFVISQRQPQEEAGGDYSQAEIKAAALQARVAFAYIGRYSQRTGQLLRKDVMAKRVVPQVERALVESRQVVIDQRLVPTVERAVLDALFVETRNRIHRSKP